MKVYSLKVELQWEDTVWRTIEVRGDQTLDALHYAIQGAFRWDDDHLYAFFLSGRFGDKKTEFVSDRESEHSFQNFLRGGGKLRRTNETTIDSLGLSPGKVIAYLFDYGDDWRHKLTLLEIREEESDTRYPRTIEKFGDAPSQYPNFEEEEEVEERPLLTKEDILKELGDFAPLATKVKAAIGVDHDEAPSKEVLRGQYETAMELYVAVESNPSRRELFNAYISGNVLGWVVHLPLLLAGVGLVQEADRLSLAWSNIDDAPNFLADRALLLAQAGLANQAREQLRQNLERFSNHIWVQINAGDAHCALKDYVSAEACFRGCLKLADDERDYSTALIRLIAMLKETGKTLEAEALEAENRELTEVARAPWIPVVREGPKIGRNDPCLCGSGKKYKKCCIDKQEVSGPK